MGTFLKYLVYVLILIALYVVIKGLYDGNINSSTTIGNAAVQVGEGTKEIAADTVNAVGDVIDDAKQARQRQ